MMICAKCGYTDIDNRACPICGYQNAKPTLQETLTRRRSFAPQLSVRLTLFMGIAAALTIYAMVVILLQLTADYSQGSLDSLTLLVQLVLLALYAFELVLCVFILRMKKWAAKTYLILSGITIALLLLSFNFILAIARGVILLFVFSKDWDKFE